MKITFVATLKLKEQREILGNKLRQLFNSQSVSVYRETSNMVEVSLFSGESLSPERLISNNSILLKWCAHKGIVIQ